MHGMLTLTFLTDGGLGLQHVHPAGLHPRLSYNRQPITLLLQILRASGSQKPRCELT